MGEGNCESKIAARQWGVNFCREASRCLAGPSGSGAGLSKKCPRASRSVKQEVPDTPGSWARDTPWDTPLNTPVFGRSRGYFRDTSGARLLWQVGGETTPVLERKNALGVQGHSGATFGATRGLAHDLSLSHANSNCLSDTQKFGGSQKGGSKMIWPQNLRMFS